MDGSLPPIPSATSLLLRSIPRTHGFEPLRVEGTLPESVRGTLFRVGPGSVDPQGVPVTHLFESDGAVTAVRFGAGKVEGAVRMVETQGRLDEERAGKPLYGFRAPYVTRMRNALAGRNKNAANTAPLFTNGRLLALCEGFAPVELDPRSLDTLGETRLGGVVKGAFSAHPHRVEKRRAHYNFGLRYGRTTHLDLYELADGSLPRHLGAVTLERPVMLHDFAATERHLVFLVSPMDVQILRAVLGIGPFGELFRYRPEHGTEVIVVPIDDVAATRRFTVDAFFQWHFANAYESGEDLVVDFVRYPDASTMERIGADEPLGGHLVRTRIDPRGKRLETVLSVDGLTEFPSVDPRYSGSEAHVVFTNTEAPGLRGLARTDLRTGERRSFVEDDRHWYSEPVFVPETGGAEGRGHLLSLVLDARAQRTHLAVFDADRLEQGPVAKAFFDQALPITFHGTFAPGA